MNSELIWGNLPYEAIESSKHSRHQLSEDERVWKHIGNILSEGWLKNHVQLPMWINVCWLVVERLTYECRDAVGI